jgi:hypothetical protein
MKKNPKLKLLAGVVLVSLMSSCEHQVVNSTKESPIDASEGALSIEDGYLKFKSSETAQEVLVSLSRTEKIHDFLTKYPEFTSMYSSYNQLVNNDIGKSLESGTISDYEGSYRIIVGSDGLKEYTRAIVDQSLSAIVNQRGLVQIGDTLYKFSEEKTLKVHIRYKQDLFSSSSGNVISKDVLHRSITINTQKNAKILSDHNFADVEYQPSGGASKRRYRIMGWSTNYWFPSNYWSTGVNIKHQRQNWWGWGAENAQSIALSGYFTVNGYPRSYAGQSSTFNFTAYNTNETQYRYSEDWTTSNMGTVYFTFSWTGIGDQNMQKDGSGSWTETI